MWGRTEERITASGVVWKEAPESAIHSVLTGGVRPMALKDCASAMVLKALRRGMASDPVCKARRRLGGRLGEQGDALPICHREEMKRNRK